MRRLITWDTGEESYHLAITKANPNILTCGARGRVLAAAKYLDCVEVEENGLENEGVAYDTEENIERGKTTIHGLYKGLPVTIFSSGEGTGSVSCTLPEVIEACDEDDINIVRVGTAGGYFQGLKVGDLFVSQSVDAQDATTDKILEGMAAVFGNLAIRQTRCSKEFFDIVRRVSDVYGGFPAAGRHWSGVKRKYFDDRFSYEPECDEGVVGALYVAGARNLLEFQSISQGHVEVTPEVYINTLLKGSGVPPYSVLVAKAVSMELSAICGYRDFYNEVDGRDISVGEILMISDMVVGESSNMDIFLKNKVEFERAHVLTGLDALVRLRR